MPAAAATIFGPQLERAEQFAQLLCTDGVVRGLIGPDEPARIWTRHLLNCAVVAELFEPEARVVDVGSGAGLPGVALALARPGLRVDLIEPLQRRVRFLRELVPALGLENRVRVVTARAEDPDARRLAEGANWVTARAVAPLDRLVRWCVPLVAPGGRVAFLKGAGAAEELGRHERTVDAHLDRVRVVHCGTGLLDQPTTVVTGTRRTSTPRRAGEGRR